MPIKQYVPFYKNLAEVMCAALARYLGAAVVRDGVDAARLMRTSEQSHDPKANEHDEKQDRDRTRADSRVGKAASGSSQTSKDGTEDHATEIEPQSSALQTPFVSSGSKMSKRTGTLIFARGAVRRISITTLPPGQAGIGAQQSVIELANLLNLRL